MVAQQGQRKLLDNEISVLVASVILYWVPFWKDEAG